MADEDPRDVLRSIAYGSDPRIAPGDRVRAIERLAEIEQACGRVSRIEDLTPEQALEEALSLESALPGIVALQRVTCGARPDDVVEPPTEMDDLRSTLELAFEVTEVQARRIVQLEAALAYEHRHRLLPAAPEPIA